MPKLMPWFHTSARLKKFASSIVCPSRERKMPSNSHLLTWSSNNTSPASIRLRIKERLLATMQCFLCHPAIFSHLPFQRFHIVKTLLITNKSHQLDTQAFPVQIIVSIKQIHLQQRLMHAEHRLNAD